MSFVLELARYFFFWQCDFLRTVLRLLTLYFDKIALLLANHNREIFLCVLLMVLNVECTDEQKIVRCLCMNFPLLKPDFYSLVLVESY